MKRGYYLHLLMVCLVILLVACHDITVYADEVTDVIMESVSDNTPDQQEKEQEDDIEDEIISETEYETSVSENNVQSEPENTVSESDANAEELIVADGSYYYLQGTLQDGGNCFVSDIMIYPTGINGFVFIRQAAFSMWRLF